MKAGEILIPLVDKAQKGEDVDIGDFQNVLYLFATAFDYLKKVGDEEEK